MVPALAYVAYSHLATAAAAIIIVAVTTIASAEDTTTTGGSIGVDAVARVTSATKPVAPPNSKANTKIITSASGADALSAE